MSTTDTPCPLAVAALEAISDQYGPFDAEDRAAFFESFDSSSPDQGFYIGSMEFWILDESERDSAWDSYLDSYIDDCILPEMPESVRYYFDDEKWKRDARMDGCGHCLNGYDGVELEAYAELDGSNAWRWIYRTN